MPNEVKLLPCACGRSEGLKRDHRSIQTIKRAARAVPDALAYIEELEALWHYSQRQGGVWRGIASAMGYEPKAHDKVKPTSRWLLDRVAKYRAAIVAENTRPTTVVTDEVVEREHVMPGDPNHLQQTALQWWLKFNFGGPNYTNRESNIAVESFKDGYRASLASMPTVVTGEQPQDLGDHALPPSGLSRVSPSQASPAAAIARKKA